MRLRHDAPGSPEARDDDGHAFLEGHVDVGSHVALIGLDGGAATGGLANRMSTPNGLSVSALRSSDLLAQFGGAM
jgi:hypothetical protein